MGRDIARTSFSEEDFLEFKRRLREETHILMQWFQNDSFDSHPCRCGFELEAWLVNGQFEPAPANEEFLARINHAMVVPELAKFNFEINSTPQCMTGTLFGDMEEELLHVWNRCREQARSLGCEVLAIGILPTLKDSMLTMDNMSRNSRYLALNEQVLKLRGGETLKLDIHGRDHLHVEHEDVMLEAATTSLQIHMQVSPREAVRHYNASQVLSAPMVALAANSPFLFGKELWEETRIPTFEQSVSVASFRAKDGETISRVTFGTGYARDSIFEAFLENLDAFPILLPMAFDEDTEWLSHLRLHNGTIWRWTRPLVGLGASGRPHLRIEHRVPAAGPSIPDTIANVAFFIGLMAYYTRTDTALEEQIDFTTARDNFYTAAQHGLNAEMVWTEGQTLPLKTIFEEHLIPAARTGLEILRVDSGHIERFIDGIIQPRIQSGQNGSFWQRNFIAKNGRDFKALTQTYFNNQDRNLPVHEWSV